MLPLKIGIDWKNYAGYGLQLTTEEVFLTDQLTLDIVSFVCRVDYTGNCARISWQMPTLSLADCQQINLLSLMNVLKEETREA